MSTAGGARLMSRGEAFGFVTDSFAKWIKHWATWAAICHHLFQQKKQVAQRVISVINPPLVSRSLRSNKGKDNSDNIA